jgi:hypothetical protein
MYFYVKELTNNGNKLLSNSNGGRDGKQKD